MGAGDVAAEPPLRASVDTIRFLKSNSQLPTPNSQKATSFLGVGIWVCFAVLAVVHAAVLATAGQRSQSAPGLPERPGGVPPVRLPMFRDVARSVGLDFVHINGAS